VYIFEIGGERPVQKLRALALMLPRLQTHQQRAVLLRRSHGMSGFRMAAVLCLLLRLMIGV